MTAVLRIDLLIAEVTVCDALQMIHSAVVPMVSFSTMRCKNARTVDPFLSRVVESLDGFPNSDRVPTGCGRYPAELRDL
jgi:hypothetical protein